MRTRDSRPNQIGADLHCRHAQKDHQLRWSFILVISILDITTFGNVSDLSFAIQFVDGTEYNIELLRSRVVGCGCQDDDAEWRN